jgi:hypothetical protein
MRTVHYARVEIGNAVDTCWIVESTHLTLSLYDCRSYSKLVALMAI